MKYINKILSLFVIALIATSCDPDAESYTPGELEDGNLNPEKPDVPLNKNDAFQKVQKRRVQEKR